MNRSIPDEHYRCPRDLWVSPTPLQRVMVVGSCLVAGWPGVIENADPGCPCDFFLTNNVGELPAEPPRSPSEYDFQVIQIPLRSVVPEGAYFRLSYQDHKAYETLFRDSKERLFHALQSIMRWNVKYGMLTFVCNFLVPQQNIMGRLLPRYDLRNMSYFIEKLNEALAEEISQYSNTFLFDLDQIVSTYGRKYFQDDGVSHANHASALANSDLEGARLEPLGAIDNYYPLRVHDYLKFGWAELVAMYRTIRQVDLVKLVVMDIDDTIWRGVAAEEGESSTPNVEGWPLGLIEALGVLKRRGVLLALVSKNDEDRVSRIWQRAVGSNRLSLEDFAVRKINWRTKAENFEDILKETNLLPRNVVFIDDNPVERASVQAAFPDIRAFGPNPFVWRRILLWSAETQVSTVTAESAARTEMIQAQVQRETTRRRMSREEFLLSLGLEVTFSEIDGTEHQSFPRAFELVNKTNQFNTTGKRWSQQECFAAFSGGTKLYAFDVKDKFTSYGLVGVLIVNRSNIAQFVMSCRVVGMEVEIAALAEIISIVLENGFPSVSADLIHTESNLLCRDLYERCGFQLDSEGVLRRDAIPLDAPEHVKLVRQQQVHPHIETVAVR